MSDKWKKALPFFLNGAFFIALGAFALVGTIPAIFTGIVTVLALGVQVFLGTTWKPPEIPKE